MPFDLETHCGGTGYLDCFCGGDNCVCDLYGGMDCDGCGDCLGDDDDEFEGACCICGRFDCNHP